MSRAWNFSAGPSALPESVLRQAAAEMLDWHGSGMSVMEMSHRSKQFVQICDEAEADLRELLGISHDYAILFMQGGATAENAIVPLNLIGRRRLIGSRRPARARADYVLTGHWSVKSYQEALKYGDIHVAATSGSEISLHGVLQKPWSWMPPVETWKVRKTAAYLHFCSNETIEGVEFANWPTSAELDAPDVPLVVDVSSHFLSRRLDVARTGMVYAGAQKNMGPAGVTVVVVRRDLLGHALPICPTAFEYATVAAAHSRFNTPPTYAIYIAGLVFKWIKAQGGVGAIEQVNLTKANLLYQYLEHTSFYHSKVYAPLRSRMNVPFFLHDDSLDTRFLEGAQQAGLLQLKGHKSVGGMRASIYNAVPLEAVQSLVAYMQDFAKRHG